MSLNVFENMLNKIMISVSIENHEKMIFTAEDGSEFIFHHYQDCCERVQIEDIIGDLNDLVGFPIVEAELVSSEGMPELLGEGTWTFYRFGTAKGSVTVRWLGISNGYYSESVNYTEKLAV